MESEPSELESLEFAGTFVGCFVRSSARAVAPAVLPALAPAVAMAFVRGASDNCAVQRREIHAMPTRTATRPILMSSNCPYHVPVSADHEPTWRQDW